MTTARLAARAARLEAAMNAAVTQVTAALPAIGAGEATAALEAAVPITVRAGPGPVPRGTRRAHGRASRCPHLGQLPLPAGAAAAGQRAARGRAPGRPPRLRRTADDYPHRSPAAARGRADLQQLRFPLAEERDVRALRRHRGADHGQAARGRDLRPLLPPRSRGRRGVPRMRPGPRTPPCGCPTAAPSATRAGNAPSTRACRAARPRPPPCSPRREPTATCATTGTGARCASAGNAAGRRRSSATPAMASPTCATGATRGRSGNARAADGCALASGSRPASRSATPATPATSGPCMTCARCQRDKPANAFWPIGPVCHELLQRHRPGPGRVRALPPVPPADRPGRDGAGICGPAPDTGIDFTCRECGRSGYPYGHGRLRLLRARRQGSRAARRRLTAPSHPSSSPSPRHSPGSTCRLPRSSGSGRARPPALLAHLVAQQRPVTHDLLDELPPGHSLHYLRQTLVQTGILPQRDEDT